MDKISPIDKEWLVPRDAWDKLSIPEKTAMLKAAVSEGVYDLNVIRHKYNEFAEGGSVEVEEEVNTNQFKEGGGIHIKPSHRGRLTELKARTGKSEAELYNDGNPAHKKMVVFARNARKWHAEGGNLFDGESEPTQQMVIVPDNTYVARQKPLFPIKPELSTEAAIKRANHVFTNYDRAKDSPMGEAETQVRNYIRGLYERGLFPWGAGMSNCTLTVSQWVDPTNPLNRAESIYNTPEKYNYTQIQPEEAVPGNIVVARNPDNGSMHTMMIEKFADQSGIYNFEGKQYAYKKGDPLMVYSRGGHDNSAIRRGIPLSVYTAESQGKTDQKFFRYNYPNEVYFPEIVITSNKNKK